MKINKKNKVILLNKNINYFQRKFLTRIIMKALIHKPGVVITKINHNKCKYRH